MADLSISFTGLTLPSPVLPASGTFDLAYRRVFDINRLGALVPKTVTLAPRRGHPPPRLSETAGGLINAIGIPSVGIDAFLECELAAYLGHTPPLVVSLSGDTAEEFAAATARLSGAPIDALELNLSCPNLEAGGVLFAADPQAAARVVAACERQSHLPLWCKLTPAAGAPREVALACEAAGADALVATNTMPGLALYPTGAPRLANRTGGLSGAPLKPIALRVVDEIARAVSLPIIGCGGVASLDDLLDYLAAGATAVAVGTATLARPRTMDRLIDALDAHLDATGLSYATLCQTQRDAALASLPPTVTDGAKERAR